MTENPDSLILEHLRQIRSRMDQMSDDVKDVKCRLTSLEHQVASVHVDMALIHSRIDRVESRLERIERRLELSETHTAN